MEKIKKVLGFTRSSSSFKISKTSEPIKKSKSVPWGLNLKDFEERGASSSNEQNSTDLQSEDRAFEKIYQREKQTLVLDLDETLVHTEPEVPKRKFFPITVEKNGQIAILYVVPRPGLLKFMTKMSEIYNICIYTCGNETYANKVAIATGINKFIYAIYSRNYCKKLEGSLYQKDLWSLGFNPQETIFVDDFSMQTAKHCENSIQIKAFEGQSCDRELRYLTEFLRHLHRVPDIRPISKHYDDFLAQPVACKKKDDRDSVASDELPDLTDLNDDDLGISGVRVAAYHGCHKLS